MEFDMKIKQRIINQTILKLKYIKYIKGMISLIKRNDKFNERNDKFNERNNKF